MSSKNWCFTLNNPTAEDDPRTWEGTAYVTWQLEEGEDETPHYQGYLVMDKKVRLSSMKKINERAHWEKRLGTQQQAIDYCNKEDSRHGIVGADGYIVARV